MTVHRTDILYAQAIDYYVYKQDRKINVVMRVTTADRDDRM
jgi:hypothetical protein